MIRFSRWLVAGVAVLATNVALALPDYVTQRWATPFADVNNQGVILGWQWNSARTSADGFLWNGRTGPGMVLNPLSAPAASTSVTYYGLSDTNEVVGSYRDASLGRVVGFINSGGNIQTLDLVDASRTEIRGISPDGHYLTGTRVSVSTGISAGFLMDRSSGQVVDISPVGATGSMVHDVTNDGRVAGSFATFSGQVVGFTFHNGVFDQFSMPGQPYTQFRGISETGYLTGFSGSSFWPDQNYGFIAQGGAIRMFERGSQVLGINDYGLAVGVTGFGMGYLLTPVPEPMSAVLMLCGLGLLGARKLTMRSQPTRA